MEETTYLDPEAQPQQVSADDALAMIWTNIRNSPLTTKDVKRMGEVARLLENLPSLPGFSDFTKQQVVLGSLLYTRSMTLSYAAIIRDLLPSGTFVADTMLGDQPASQSHTKRGSI